VHGQPLWCRIGHKRKRWLFSTHAGWWMLADTRRAFREESCAGLLCTCGPHEGNMPNQVEGWQYGDGWGWRTDPNISVVSIHSRAFSPPTLSEPPSPPPQPDRSPSPPYTLYPPSEPPVSTDVSELLLELQAERERRVAAESAAIQAQEEARKLRLKAANKAGRQRDLLSPSQSRPPLLPRDICSPPLSSVPLQLSVSVLSVEQQKVLADLLPVCGVYSLRRGDTRGYPAWEKWAVEEEPGEEDVLVMEVGEDFRWCVGDLIRSVEPRPLMLPMEHRLWEVPTLTSSGRSWDTVVLSVAPL